MEMTQYPYPVRVKFVVELATRLHIYGTTAQRLEGAIDAVSTRLGLRCDPWSSPTGLILSFSDTDSPELLSTTTQVIRLDPGDVDLRKLCQVDAIAEQVLSGDLDIEDALAALHALDTPAPEYRLEWLFTVLGFGLTSAAVAILFRGGWNDAAVAGIIGLVIGLLLVFGAGRARLTESLELFAAFLATLLATLVASFVVPLSVKTVTIASLIVLMPGMTLTNAVSELTSQHLVSGTARIAGAMGTLLKLAFGSLMASQLAMLLSWQPLAYGDLPVLPVWAEWVALLASGVSFAVLFKAAWRDFPLVIIAVCVAYVSTRLVGLWLPGSASVFIGGVVITVFSNAYARWAKRPGALIRVPGIILMVPGSVSFRGLSSMFEQNVTLGLDTTVDLTIILASLVGGILIGNVLIPARRNL